MLVLFRRALAAESQPARMQQPELVHRMVAAYRRRPRLVVRQERTVAEECHIPRLNHSASRSHQVCRLGIRRQRVANRCRRVLCTLLRRRLDRRRLL